jgi:hypothetical protein
MMSRTVAPVPNPLDGHPRVRFAERNSADVERLIRSIFDARDSLQPVSRGKLLECMARLREPGYRVRRLVDGLPEWPSACRWVLPGESMTFAYGFPIIDGGFLDAASIKAARRAVAGDSWHRKLLSLPYRRWWLDCHRGAPPLAAALGRRREIKG